MTESTARNEKALNRLREEVPPEQIEKLPRYAGYRDTPKRDRKSGDCSVCGKYHVLPAVHLDYLGHSGTTAKILNVDPLWNWKPVATERDGRPKFERASELIADSASLLLTELEGVAIQGEDSTHTNRIHRAIAELARSIATPGEPLGLWGEVTILGVTRLGFGTIEPGKSDPEKELIGDMIRNAAMRFGVALELWKGGTTERVGLDGQLIPDDQPTTAQKTTAKAAPAQHTPAPGVSRPAHASAQAPGSPDSENPAPGDVEPAQPVLPSVFHCPKCLKRYDQTTKVRARTATKAIVSRQIKVGDAVFFCGGRTLKDGDKVVPCKWVPVSVSRSDRAQKPTEQTSIPTGDGSGYPDDPFAK